MAANIIIKTDERRQQEASVLKSFNAPNNAVNRESASYITAAVNDIKRKEGIK